VIGLKNKMPARMVLTGVSGEWQGAVPNGANDSCDSDEKDRKPGTLADPDTCSSAHQRQALRSAKRSRAPWHSRALAILGSRRAAGNRCRYAKTDWPES
jgi:hypothetical protein